MSAAQAKLIEELVVACLALVAGSAASARLVAAVEKEDHQVKTPSVYRLEKLGYANQAVSYGNNHAVLAPGTDGQGSFFYISYYRTEGRAEILACDPATQARRRYASNSLGLYGLLKARDGTIYAGGINPGHLYALRPGNDKLEIAGRPAGVQYIWDLVEAPDGQVYGGCYPGAKLMAYDPKAQTCKVETDFRTHPGIAGARDYLRSLCAAPDGRLWCSINHPGLLLVYDPKTGKKEQVLPADLQKSMGSHLAIVGGEVYVVTGSGPGTAPSLLVYEARTGKLRQRFDQAVGSAVPGDQTNGCYFYDRGALVLHRCRPESGKLETILKGVDLGWCQRIEGERCLHGMLDQDYCRYDLQKKEIVFREKRPVSALASLPDGRILCAGGGKLAVFDPEKTAFVLEQDCGAAGNASALAVGPDGSAYGIHNGAVFHIGLDKLSTQDLAKPGGKFLALDRFGSLYFARGAELFRLVRKP